MRRPFATAPTGATAPLGVDKAAHTIPAVPGVTARLIARRTVGDTDYVLREVTLPPGQGTGWHYHDGPVVAYVRQGTLHHYDSTCVCDGVYPQGTTVREPSGPSAVHLGQNLGAGALVLELLYVLPHGAPLSREVPNPGCPFA